MATEAELLAQALAVIKQATVWTDDWLDRVADDRYTPDQLHATRHYRAHKLLEQAAHAAPPPPPPPVHLQYVAVGADNPMDALQWPRCTIWFTADPGPAYSRWVTRGNGNTCRQQGHEVGVWYVPDQVSHARAQEAARTLGVDDAHPVPIYCDIETKERMRLAIKNGVRAGIANLSDICEWDPVARNYVAPDLVGMIETGEFQVINEFYWNQSKRRLPDNHNLPVASICIAVYNGCSDSSEPDCWEPHVADYRAAGCLWPGTSVYSNNMRPADWSAMPVRP